MTRSTLTLPSLALAFLTLGAAAQAQEVLPENIAAPEATPILTVSAYGAQIYDCKVDDAHRGEGQLTGVTLIQRINTKGGAASGACETAGALLSVPNSTD